MKQIGRVLFTCATRSQPACCQILTTDNPWLPLTGMIPESQGPGFAGVELTETAPDPRISGTRYPRCGARGKDLGTLRDFVLRGWMDLRVVGS